MRCAYTAKKGIDLNMSYKIVVDSCCELPEEFTQNVNTEIVPMGIQVDECNITDDATFDQKSFLDKVAASPNGPKSHCPSPEKYVQAMKGDTDRIYIITLSAELSGSYNSAMTAKDIFVEEYGERDIYIFNSRSASCGETQIAYWIRELEEEGTPFEELISITEDRINARKTFFVLESLEVLRKNGRLGNIKAFVANTLNIKPIMAGTKEGTIVQEGQARGMARALSKMIDLTLKDIDTENRRLMISHCNCKERAEKLLKEYQKKAKFKETLIINTRGISSMYASDGGIIVTL